MRGYSNYKNVQSVSLFERLIAALTYITTGMVGFVWIIFAQISGKRLKPFLKFHIYQSIMLALLYIVCSIALRLLYGAGIMIPFVRDIVIRINFFFFSDTAVLGVSIVNFFVLVVLAYLVIVSLLGKEGNIPKISDIIRSF